MLSRGDIEVAQHYLTSRFSGFFQLFEGVLHLFQKGQLMGKFVIYFRVRLIATGRHIKIMHRHRFFARLHRYRNMPPIALAAIIDNMTVDNLMARQRRHPVIALNAVFGDMVKTRLGKGFFGKLIIRAFGFLQTDNIGVELFNQLHDQRRAQSHRVNIP